MVFCEKEFEKWWKEINGWGRLDIGHLHDILALVWNKSWSTCGKLIFDKMVIDELNKSVK